MIKFERYIYYLLIMDFNGTNLKSFDTKVDSFFMEDTSSGGILFTFKPYQLMN